MATAAPERLHEAPPQLQELLATRHPVHMLLVPFSAKSMLEGDGGGLTTAILDGIERYKNHNGSGVWVASPDQDGENHDDLGVTLIPAHIVGTDDPRKYDVWFDMDWAMFHPHSHTLNMYSKKVIEFMFGSDNGRYVTQPEDGSLHVAEYVNNFSPGSKYPDVINAFARGFNRVMHAIPEGSTLNVQDWLAFEVLRDHADALHDRGITMSYHHHVPIPEGLDRYPRGRAFLEAISKADILFVHTDEYRRNLEAQMERAKLRIPPVELYDLGVSKGWLNRGLAEVDANNYMNTTEFSGLPHDSRQHELIAEMFRVKSEIPHVFLQFDRADPIKGNLNFMEAIDLFLSQSGESLEVMRQKYRFFMIMPQLEWDLVEGRSRDRYVTLLREKAAKLEQKYPGVFFYSGEVPRTLIPALLKDVTVVAPGGEDGLHLASAEALYINALARCDRTAIISRNIGIALHALQRSSNGGLVHFINPGDIEELTGAIRHVVTMNGSGEFAPRTQQFVEEVIIPREDTVIYEFVD